jgi:hypothetical protein
VSVVTVEERGLASIIAINRPEKLNAINRQVAIDLQSAFAAFDHSVQRVAPAAGRFRAAPISPTCPSRGVAYPLSGSRPKSQ